MASYSANLMVAAGLAVVCAGTLCACPSSENPAPTQAASTSTPAAAGPTPTTSPEVVANAEPVATPTPDVRCKQALASLGAGDRSALKSLPPETQDALVRNGGQDSMLAFTCLAIADGDTTYCDVLPEEFKRKCTERFQLVSELKGLPKDALKPHILHRMCMGTGGSTAQCGQLQEALTTHNPAKCSDLPAPWGGGFCAALASGDPATCNNAPEPAQRDGCIALVTNDPSRCPKDAADCVRMARNFAVFTKEGLGAEGSSDPTLAAVRKGKDGCVPLLARLEQVCAPVPAPPAPAAASTPVPSP